jgi:hypothetical protein
MSKHTHGAFRTPAFSERLAAQPSRQPLTVTGGYSKRPGKDEDQTVSPRPTTDLERLACSSLEGLTAAPDVVDDAAGR